MATREGRLTVDASQEALGLGRVAADGSKPTIADATRMLRNVSHVRVTTAALFLLVGLALVLRGFVAVHQPLFVDEAFSLLAIHAVGERGLPLLPTGSLYLHGATLTYLLAPLSVLGWAESESLNTMRIVSAAAGAISVLLAFRLAVMAGATSMTSLFAAALIAVDPASVEWGGYLRMYALAQMLAIGVGILFLRAIEDTSGDIGTGARRHLPLAGLVLVFWLDVFTHLATALLWPAMAIVAVFVLGKTLLGTRRDMSFALAACLVAPATLIALNSLIGPGAGTKISAEAEGLPGVSFLGDDKIQIRQLMHPDPTVWSSLFGPGPLEYMIPLLATFATGLLVAVLVLRPDVPWWSPRTTPAIPALMALYWIPVLLFAFLAGDTSTRYGLFLVPFGCVLIAVALKTMASLVNSWMRQTKVHLSGGTGLAVVLAALMLFHGVAGIAETLALAASGKRDLTPALRYVREHRAIGETVITVVPPPMAAFVLGDTQGLVFLPGAELSLRTQRYTRLSDDGHVTDYWLGVPALGTNADTCAVLAASPNSWLVFSNSHWERWGYTGGSRSRTRRRVDELQQVIRGTSNLAFEDRQGRVFRVQAADAWSETARNFCDRAIKRTSRGPESPD